MDNIQYCVWIRKSNASSVEFSYAGKTGTLFLWRYCEFLTSARYYAGVARDKETEALISTWEKSKAFLEK